MKIIMKRSCFTYLDILFIVSNYVFNIIYIIINKEFFSMEFL